MILVDYLRNKFNRLPLPLKAGLFFAGAEFLQRACQLITTPIFTRMLSKQEFGISVTFVSWQNILLLLVTLSLQKGMFNLFKYSNKHSKIASAVCSEMVVLSLFWLALAAVFLEELTIIMGMPKALTLLLFTSFIPLSIFNTWIVLKKYEYKYKACLIQAVISTFLTTLVSILLVMFYSQTAIVRIAPGIIISCLISIYLYYDMVKYGKCFYDQSIWKFVFSFCIVLLPHYFSEFILQSSDKIMIARMCGHDEVALYSIAYTVGALINVLVSAINSTLIPFRYQRMNTKEYSIISTASSIILCFVSLVLLIIMLLSPEIVYFFGGSGYLDAQILVVPICLGSFFNFVFQFFSSIQEYYEYTKPICFVSVVCAVLNIALNYFFINLYGYVAAAYTTFVTYLCFSVFHYYFYNKACTKQLGSLRPYDIKSFLFISLFTIFSAIYSYAVLDYRIIRVVSLVIVIIVLLIFSKKAFKFYKINR